MHSTAPTVAAYLASLPAERRRAVDAVCRVVRRHLPKGYEEVMNWGMVTWQVPLSRFPDTYNGQPLCYAAVASQKSYCALYLMGCYVVPAQLAALRKAFDASGQKMDMGKSCLRFTRSEDLPLEAIGALIAALPPDTYIEASERARAKAKRARKAARAAARKAPRKPAEPRSAGKRKTATTRVSR